MTSLSTCTCIYIYVVAEQLCRHAQDWWGPISLKELSAICLVCSEPGTIPSITHHTGLTKTWAAHWSQHTVWAITAADLDFSIQITKAAQPNSTHYLYFYTYYVYIYTLCMNGMQVHLIHRKDCLNHWQELYFVNSLAVRLDNKGMDECLWTNWNNQCLLYGSVCDCEQRAVLRLSC